MKKVFLVMLAAFATSIICLAQVSSGVEGKIAMQTQPGPNGQFLKITNCYPGSLEDIAGLKYGDRIYLINDKKVGELSDPAGQIQNSPGNFVKLTISRFGKQELFEVNVPRISSNIGFNSCFTEGLLYAAAFRGYMNTYNLKLETMYDESRDMLKYKTYDFEYTSMDEPLQEKILFNKLEIQLNEMGLKRSPENPDLLVFVSFYSGAKEQYVPPKQIVSTRIKNTYNWYWGVVPVPITESKSVDGYTEVTYFTSFNLKFMDAKEIDKSKTPPVIWSCSLARNSSTKTQLSEFASYFIKLMLYQFPEVYRNNSICYYPHAYPYLGLVYNITDMRTIGDVIPGSPAEKSGIQKGDQIVSINGLPLSGKLTEYNSGMKNNKGMTFLLAYNTLGMENNVVPNNNNVIELKLKRNGKPVIISVTPEQKVVYLAPQTSYYIKAFNHLEKE